MAPPTDAGWYADAAHDPKIQRYTSESPTLTAAEVRAAILALADQTDRVGLVICDATTGQRLGNIAVRHHAAVGEASYWVAASARGRGVATRAATAIGMGVCHPRAVGDSAVDPR